MEIAAKYLAPTSKKESGLSDYNVNLSGDAMLRLIKQYCRESGVRNLKKQIDKIYRKAAFKIVEKGVEKGPNGETLLIDDNHLPDYVGPPMYTTDRLYKTSPPGVVMGLAWTPMGKFFFNLGGSSLFIESVIDSPLTMDSKAHFHRTGQMGDVMKESTTIAYTYAKSLFARRFPHNTFFAHASIHMHVPEGATPKDGNNFYNGRTVGWMHHDNISYFACPESKYYTERRNDWRNNTDW